MKRWPIILAFLILALSASAGDVAYHFNTYLFDAKEMYKPAGEGDGNPEVCRHLFAPPQIYDGHYIPIGTNATAFGVVAVTDGKTTKILPLFKWTDDKGKHRFGCNGPTPWFARGEESEDALLKTIVEAIRKKTVPAEAQAEVDRLNTLCSNEAWRSEIEMIELPETRPANRVVSGEASAFVSECKKRIAQHGVRVKWNPTRKVYDIEETQPSVGR